MTDITKKQYIITNKKISGYDMRQIPIFEDVSLYVSKELNFLSCTDKNGKDYFLLGNAFCTDRPGKSVQDDICGCDFDDVDRLTFCWTGRWGLISGARLYTDACGLMSAFYYSAGDCFGISSSLALLKSVFGLEYDSSLGGGKMSYQLLPLTVCGGVSQAFCTQGIDFSSSGVKLFPRMWIKNYTAQSIESKCALAAQILENAAINISEYSHGDILLALTAGKDSRLSLAAFLKAGKPFSAYTAEHGRISASDRKLPKKISQRFNFPYTYIKRGSCSQDKSRDYFNFTAGNSRGADMEFYSCGQFDRIPKNSVVIRSGIFEAGQNFMRSVAGNTKASFVRGIKNYYPVLKNEGKESEAFEKWLAYTEKNPCRYIDLRDRFYIEQRVGGWAAAIEQSLDMNDFMSIQIANCAELISILICSNDAERSRLALSFDTVKLLQPELMDFPVNKPSIKDRILLLGAAVKKVLRKLANR